MRGVVVLPSAEIVDEIVAFLVLLAVPDNRSIARRADCCTGIVWCLPRMTFWGLMLTFGDHLCGTKHPLTEQSEARSPIELAFDRLEAVCPNLGLSLTPPARVCRLPCG